MTLRIWKIAPFLSLASEHNSRGKKMHGSKCNTFPKRLQNEPKVPKALKVNACGELQSAETNIHFKSCAREKFLHI